MARIFDRFGFPKTPSLASGPSMTLHFLMNESLFANAVFISSSQVNSIRGQSP